MSGTSFVAPWGRSLVLSTSVQVLVLLAICAATLVSAGIDPDLKAWERVVALLIGIAGGRRS